ncbi:hypothetical protein LPJ75_003756 [Coemansia sp. RSA 2598]|nr:hypothetical protein LPJ75_003756 [Coemansia sp. RSA 2598]
MAITRNDGDLAPGSTLLQTRRVTVPQAFTKKPAAATKRASLDGSQSRRLSEHFFGKVHQHHALFGADKSTKYTIQMFPQIDRGFFQSEDEWTCYRRNYFQISSYFWLCANSQPINSTDCRYYISQSPDTNADSDPRSGTEDDHDQAVDTAYVAVNGFSLGISARVSDDSTSVELVQHTPKRDKGPQTVPQPQPIRPSPNGVAGAETPDIVSFERLQFKTATANNGKRRAAQQYYVLSLQIYADCADGKQILLASTSSCPVVVRGRSPGHYIDGGKRKNGSVSNISLSSTTSGSNPPLLAGSAYMDTALPQEVSTQGTHKRKRQKQRQQKKHAQSHKRRQQDGRQEKEQAQNQAREQHVQPQDLSPLSELRPLDTSANISAGSAVLTGSTDAVLSAAAAAMAASRYNYLANEVAHVFPELNPATAAVAAAAAAAAMASAKQQQQQNNNSTVSMTNTMNPLGLHTAIPLTMTDPITECPSQQLSNTAGLESQLADEQFRDQLQATAPMLSTASSSSFVSIKAVPTEQTMEVDDAGGVGAVRRSARADSLFEKT